MSIAVQRNNPSRPIITNDSSIDCEKLSCTSIDTIRGGGDNENDDHDENQELDDYVARLIASVDEDGSEEAEVKDMILSENENVGDEDTFEKLDEAANPIEEMDDEIKNEETIQSLSRDGNTKKPRKKSKKRRKRRGGTKGDESVEKQSADQQEEATCEPLLNSTISSEDPLSQSNNTKKVPKTNTQHNIEAKDKRDLRPTRMQHFLLSKGKIGRALASLSILCSQFIKIYLPEVSKVGTFVLSLLFQGGEDDNYRGSRRSRKRGERVHSKYATFADSSAGTVGGKKMTKAQSNAMDDLALKKLKNLASKSSDAGGKGTMGGKYHHLSVSFLTRLVVSHYMDGF